MATPTASLFTYQNTIGELHADMLARHNYLFCETKYLKTFFLKEIQCHNFKPDCCFHFQFPTMAEAGPSTPAQGASHRTYSSENRVGPVVMKEIRQLWIDQLLCDYTLVTADNKEFRVHRSHLACVSDYLKAMLSGESQNISIG